MENLFNEDKTPNCQAIAKFLDLTIGEVTYSGDATALGEAIQLVYSFFNDEAKTKQWFFTPNPQFGGIVPVEFVHLGRSAKLLAIVKGLLEENKP